MSISTSAEIGGVGGAGSTRKLYVAVSLPGPHGSGPMQAVAVILYVPGETLATTKEPDVIVPPLIVQLVGRPTGMPDNEQLVSSELNPEPVTVMVVPGWASEGLSTICGTEVVVTVKNVVASPVSPPLVATVIV